MIQIYPILASIGELEKLYIYSLIKGSNIRRDQIKY